MKTTFSSLFIGLALLFGVYLGDAQTAQFFRIVGPTVATINSLNSDGTLVWSGASPEEIYQVQTASSLIGETHWADYVQLPVTNNINTNLIVSFNPPAGIGFYAFAQVLLGLHVANTISSFKAS
jgi:hypothetical protein